MANRSARALVVELVADVQEFVKGTQKADTALGDFVGDAERDLDRVETATQDMAADAERHFDNLARSAKQSFQKIDTAAKQGLGDDGVRGTVKEAGAEAGAEFAQNMGEGISSGDFTGVATGTAGGLAASFSQMGPIGIVAGIGVGIAGVMFDHFLKESKKRAEQISNLVAKQMAGVVQEFQDTLSATTAGQALSDLVIEIGEGDFKKGFDKLADAANTLGLNMDDVLTRLQTGKLTTGDINTAFQGVVDKSKATGAALAPAAKAQDQLTTAVELQATAAGKAATQTTIMKNAMNPAAAKAQQAARNADLLGDHMHGVSGDAQSAAGHLRTAAEQMLLLNARALDLDRNMSNVAYNSARTAENVAAAAGQSIGGRNRL